MRPLAALSVNERRTAASTACCRRVEHIIARQHQLNDAVYNLALACDRCNGFKGPNLSSIDQSTDQIVPLFHPRRDDWDQHFQLVGGPIAGRTPTGRATARLLMMNHVRRVELRLAWIDENGSLCENG